MIHIKNLQKSYGNHNALSGIDLHVPEGELFAYLGPNGAGKTTTIRILTGLTRLTAGTAALNGHDIREESMAAKRQCGLVPQHVNLDSELTVKENLDIHGRLFGMSGVQRKQRIEELLTYIEIHDRIDSLVKQLSGGLKRRVMIARALLHDPRILFLDEPTVGLDASIRRRIWSLIKKIQKQGTTIFLTTHYIEEAEFLADRVAFLDDGRIVAVDTPTALMDSVGHWAIDWVTEEGMQSAYFPSREAAQASAAAGNSGFTLRRVNLEDAFLSLTGKKVEPGGGEAKTVHGKSAHGSHGHSAHGSSHGGHSSKAHTGHGAH
ncbi:ABC transporter ATP-binding protein [Desulfosarcina ovata subsp. sediminis]|uniref:ABC transporter ATP-binding protein n=1 Tax=Desulfosarcina ovata subsp. sediminis TaxID=885957 RepID=A0A5K7ZMV0_9BACT|nr:ABC transporter ATP-binding protein [Desulfosarcina ovata]BBO82586.1 ABC transporter ATP-binding protein [Desulfosarcina ovata subsp. sediminis]